MAYFRCGQNVKAYKIVRKVSTKETLRNWALLGAILSGEEDISFCRSYYKRMLAKPELSTCPFVPMILGCNYLQKQ